MVIPTEKTWHYIVGADAHIGPGEFCNPQGHRPLHIFSNTLQNTTPYERKEKSLAHTCQACVGEDLSSRAVSRKVLSAQTSLTTVFGMGTGGPSLQKTPTIYVKRFPSLTTVLYHVFPRLSRGGVLPNLLQLKPPCTQKKQFSAPQLIGRNIIQTRHSAEQTSVRICPTGSFLSGHSTHIIPRPPPLPF